MTIEVARRYDFQGIHHVPDLPAPWSGRHTHSYMVEVVAQGTGRIVVDTDTIDAAWRAEMPEALLVDLDERYGPANTTVEALAARWLRILQAWVPEVVRVVVWEDLTRWGSATA